MSKAKDKQVTKKKQSLFISSDSESDVQLSEPTKG